MNKANLILFDVGANAMEPFNGLPHLSHPIVKDTETGIYVIEKLAEEMERRIKLEFAELKNLPAIICIIDEYVSFINNIGSRKQSQQIESNISNLLRRGRNAKIHIILATQDPTLKNMKIDIGVIRTRMAFACAKYHNSIAILGEGGAKKLSGNGAMLYKFNEYPHPLHIQGAFITKNELKQLMARITIAKHDLSSKFIIPDFGSIQVSAPVILDDGDKVPNVDLKKKELVDIIMWLLGRNTISASQIREYFYMGNRAYGIVDELFRMKLVSDKFHNQPRMVLPKEVVDIPEDVIESLMAYGITSADITTAIQKRDCKVKEWFK